MNQGELWKISRIDIRFHQQQRRTDEEKQFLYHKEGCPLRPVVSMVNTSEYFLAKYLDSFIQPTIPNSFSVSSTNFF